MGRNKKYTSRKALEKAVDGYFASISYQKPVIADLATGYVDEEGNAEVKRMMLRGGEDGTGPPVTVTEWISKPNLAGLCLYLGVSKETLRQYGKNKELAPVIERARERLEDYWVSRLDGKGAHGAKFVLTNNFGWEDCWKDKQEVTQQKVDLSMEDYLEELDKKGDGQEF